MWVRIKNGLILGGAYAGLIVLVWELRGALNFIPF